MMKLVAVSGGFDPIHPGHIDYLKAAADLGDCLIVFLNTDEWLRKKKGFVFMPWPDRAKLLGAYGFVNMVVEAEDGDGTVTRSISRYRPAIFANGGDRGPDTTPEIEICNHLGIELAFNVGGGKTHASSDICRRFLETQETRLVIHGAGGPG